MLQNLTVIMGKLKPRGIVCVYCLFEVVRMEVNGGEMRVARN